MSKLDAYFKLSEIEQRFNESGAGVRTLASGWMVAALAGLGWLLDPSKSGPWVVPLGLRLSMICTMAVAGIATLWVLDQLVYHRLLMQCSWSGCAWNARIGRCRRSTR